ncbi:hypothetical protein [Streptomyces sp. NPDC059080]|uniref:hypothetical protein n=1 Tax=Streptomyces sp. NPDC059080 TaxID=3346718 RepID=UPI0036AE3243
MARGGGKRLPVVNDVGMLEGVVSRSGLLKVFLRDDAEIAAGIRRAVLGAPAARWARRVRLRARVRSACRALPPPGRADR